jgi:hypothetical protein
MRTYLIALVALVIAALPCSAFAATQSPPGHARMSKTVAYKACQNELGRKTTVGAMRQCIIDKMRGQ